MVVHERFSYVCTVCKKELGEEATLYASYPFCEEHCGLAEDVIYQALKQLAGGKEPQEFHTFEGLDVPEFSIIIDLTEEKEDK